MLVSTSHRLLTVGQMRNWNGMAMNWPQRGLKSGVISSGNAWERRSQSYFDSGNGVPRNEIVR